MNNSFLAPCHYCGGSVPAGSGIVEQIGHAFKAAHQACADASRRSFQAFAFGSPCYVALAGQDSGSLASRRMPGGVGAKSRNRKT